MKCIALYNCLKVDMPNSMTTLNHTPIFECYVVWCGSKNKYQKILSSKRLDYVLKSL